jgi:ATP-dependent Clp protease ATP-binding subunit ClpC
VATQIPFTPRASRALALAAGEAEGMQQQQVSPEHIFLGLVKEGEGLAAVVLRKLGVDLGRTRDEIVKELRKPAG